MPKKKPHPLTKVRYYVTLVAAVVAILSFFALLFLVPFVYDPTISTLNAGFPEEPDTCLLSEVRVAHRLSECNWTSCSEGCTAPNTQCVQIKVNVSHVPFSQFNPSPDFYTEQIWVGHDLPLKINIQACGYPPRVNCTNFLKNITKYLPRTGAPPPPELFYDGDQSPQLEAREDAGPQNREAAEQAKSSGLREPVALSLQSRPPSPGPQPPLPSPSPSPPPPGASSRLTNQQPHHNTSLRKSDLYPFQIMWPPAERDKRDKLRAVVVRMRPGMPVAVPCHPARARADLVITDYDHARVLMQLVVAAVVPTALLFISALLLCYCHAACCRRHCPQLPIPEEPDRMTMLPPDVIVSRASDMDSK